MSEEQNFDCSSDSRQNIDAYALSIMIQAFVRNNKKITPVDWIALNKLTKQLDKQRYSESRKVLRSMRNRFIAIRNKYQEEER